MDFLLIPFIFSGAWLFTFAEELAAIAVPACDVFEANFD
jgi:hypothetical protein